MDELIEYIIINKDLNMSPGKVAAAASHVATICAVDSLSTLDSIKKTNFYEWYNKEQKKIVLQAHEKILLSLENDYYSIRDVGYNEVKPNSLTAVCLGIMTREEASKIVKRLQIYK